MRTLVADLASDDWRRADRAAAELGSMGNAITGALQGLRDQQAKAAQAERLSGLVREFEAETADVLRAVRQ